MMTFEEFWLMYPRRVGRLKAQKAWDKLSMFDRNAVIEGLRLWKRSADWQDLLFVPHASTFLNQRRWEEKPVALRPEQPNRGGTLVDGARYSARDQEYYERNGFKL